MKSFRIQITRFDALRVYSKIRSLLNLKEDFDELGCSDVIRANTDFRSGNAWSLIFAIFVASIGLQVNSTAIIIGAMLISPLMGPIVGAGFSLGIHDFELLKKSITNLIYAVIISLLTSTVFFLFSPSGLAQSELIARTQPTFFDVMIAVFGGAAGIVAASRKVKGNAIPGVAIATALMPPLCTAGYGLANFKFGFVVGALYLFTINATFIFASTYLFVRFLGFSIVVDRDVNREKIIHKWMTIASVIVILPSIFMAWYLHKKTNFETISSHFIEHELNFTNTIVAQKNLAFGLSGSVIQLRTIGAELSKAEVEDLARLLISKYEMDGVRLEIKALSKENYTLSDLDQRFVTKADLIKIKDEMTAIKDLKVGIALRKFRDEFNAKYPLIKLEISLAMVGQRIEVALIWKTRVSQKRQFEAESLIKGILTQEMTSINHRFEFL